MSATGSSLTRRSNQAGSPRAPQSVGGQIGRIVWHTVVILLAAGVVIAAAQVVARTPLASSMPMTFLPGAATREGGPPPGLAQGGADAASAQPGRGRPQPAGQPSGESGAASQGQGLFSGRNAPSLQRGLPDLARYAGTFAVLVAGVAVVLRVVRPRRRRRPAAVQRTTPAAAARSRTDRAA